MVYIGHERTPLLRLPSAPTLTNLVNESVLHFGCNYFPAHLIRRYFGLDVPSPSCFMFCIVGTLFIAHAHACNSLSLFFFIHVVCRSIVRFFFIFSKAPYLSLSLLFSPTVETQIHLYH
ncbi:hypothetical protein BKA57DRAFT_462549 [Linnemannia elongata]|nr:hypothetical protein BKA57DRAFT_462549 [Linnemannia elongata]